MPSLQPSTSTTFLMVSNFGGPPCAKALQFFPDSTPVRLHIAREINDGLHESATARISLVQW